jgi:signal transduction histidine kinase
MDSIPYQARLVRRTYWLIRLRWVAILGLCMATYLAHNIWHVVGHGLALYGIAGFLILENCVLLACLKGLFSFDIKTVEVWIPRSIHAQISLDLVLLTVLLHYTGGVENPFMGYFVFHMVITSILLSRRESYLQATLATCLITLMALLEYRGILPHYPLRGVLAEGYYTKGIYVLGEVGTLASTLYLVVYMTSDISKKLRNQEEAYRLANLELQQKDRIKDEYVSRVTHDIKGHLGAISSRLDVVVGGLLGPLNEKQQEFVERASGRTDTLIKFVRTLLRLMELRLNHSSEQQSFALVSVIERALAIAENRATEKQITLSHTGGSDADRLYGDELSIEEAITNLLLNAIKYTPAEGKVDLVIHSGELETAIVIQDTGIGIPAAYLSKVFDEFCRAPNARKIEKDGTGLGLSIVKQIVERHGGKVSVQSTEGKGATFTLTLPLVTLPVDDAACKTDTTEVAEVKPKSKGWSHSEVL